MSDRDAPELWLPVLGYEGLYEVSDAGRVRSLNRVVVVRGIARRLRGVVLRAAPNRGGYPIVGLWRDSRKHTACVHSLVAAAFIGPRPVGLDIAHGDGNPANSRADNLRYATSSENNADKVMHGTAQRGERHPMAKLTAEQVSAIRAAPWSQRMIAKQFGVCQTTVSEIRRGKTWLRGAHARASAAVRAAA